MSAVLSNSAQPLPDALSANTPGRASPLRRFGLTLLLAAALPLAFALLAPLEHGFLAGPALGDAPLLNAMLVLALPHYGIALLFMVTSRRNRDVAGRVSIGAAVVLSLVLCGWLYRASRQQGLPDGAILLVGLYFLIHIYQDEWQFYRRDRGDRVSLDGATVALLTIALIGGIFALAWLRATLVGDPVHNLRGAFDSQLIASVDPTLLCLTGCVAFAALVGGCVRVAVRRSGATLWSLVKKERPLWAIFWLLPQIYIASVLLHGKCEPVVLIHAAGWWIVTTSTLATGTSSLATATSSVAAGARCAQTPGLWSRLRTTQAGFQWFHGALVGFALVTLLAVRHHGPAARVPQTDWIRNVFYYTSVVHITLSMFPPWFRRLFEACRADRVPREIAAGAAGVRRGVRGTA